MKWHLYPANELRVHQDQWQSLSHEGTACPLLNKDFVIPLLDELGTGMEILGCCEDDNRVQAMAILARTSPGVWQTFQPSQAPLGMWMHRPQAELGPILKELFKTLPGYPLVVGITQQDPDFFRRPENVTTLKTLDYQHTARISIKGSFEEYWGTRGKNLRHNMKTQRSKLAKKGVSLRLEAITTPTDVAHAIVDYGSLESAGWKGKLGTAVDADNAQGRFYRTMLEAFCRRGAARIYRYWYNDRIASMNLCIEGNDTIIILKTTYDESITDGSSPAFLMRQEQCQELFNEGRLKSIEFYGKAMSWHFQWTKEIRTIYHVNTYRYPLLPLIHNVMRKSPAIADK
jgi:hypothetical protein